MYRRVELGISAALLLLGVGILVGAGQITRLPLFEDPIGARGFAYIVGTATVILATILLLTQLLRLRRGVTSWSEPEDPELTGDDPRYPASTRQATGIVIAVFVATMLLNTLGWLISIGGFVAAGMALMGGRGLGKLVVYPVGFALVTYLMFDTMLNVRLPPGVLRPILDLVGLE